MSMNKKQSALKAKLESQAVLTYEELIKIGFEKLEPLISLEFRELQKVGCLFKDCDHDCCMGGQFAATIFELNCMSSDELFNDRWRVDIALNDAMAEHEQRWAVLRVIFMNQFPGCPDYLIEFWHDHADFLLNAFTYKSREALYAITKFYLEAEVYKYIRLRVPRNSNTNKILKSLAKIA